MILFSRLEKAKKNNKCISQRLKDLKKRTNRGIEIMKVKLSPASAIDKRANYRPGARFSKAPESFRFVKPLQNLEPCDYRAVLFTYSKDEGRFPSYKKFRAYTLLRF